MRSLSVAFRVEGEGTTGPTQTPPAALFAVAAARAPSIQTPAAQSKLRIPKVTNVTNNVSSSICDAASKVDLMQRAETIARGYILSFLVAVGCAEREPRAYFKGWLKV